MQKTTGKLVERIVARKLAQDLERGNVLPPNHGGYKAGKNKHLGKHSQIRIRCLQTIPGEGKKLWPWQSIWKMRTTEYNSNCWWNSLCNMASARRSQDGWQQRSSKERLPCDLETGSPRPNNWQWDFHKTVPCPQSSTMSTQRDWRIWAAMV